MASCDDRPLVVAFHPNKTELAKLEAGLRNVAWHSSIIGRAEYVFAKDFASFQLCRALGRPEHFEAF